MLGAVKCHLVETDKQERMAGEGLSRRIEEDKQKGLIPFFVSCVLYLISHFEQTLILNGSFEDEQVFNFIFMCVSEDGVLFMIYHAIAVML